MPPPEGLVRSVPATLQKDPVRQIRLGKFTATFERTTLDEIRKAVRAGSIDHAGEAGGSQYWICYSLPGQRVWLISNGEMGGPDHVLTQVHAVSGSGFRRTAACPLLPKRFRPVLFDFGWLGSGRKRILKTLGAPSGTPGNLLIYLYEGTRSETSGGEHLEWDVTTYVEAAIVKGAVASLYVSHVTSY